MDAVWSLLFFGGVIAIIVRVRRAGARGREAAARARAQGHLLHRRGGEYPAACSWCKSTTLARKLFIFERVDGVAWHACDVIERLKTCADSDVDELSRALGAEDPRWRRFCTERCANEFFGGERGAAAEIWVGCDYCSMRFPSGLERCSNCGAGRQRAA